MLVRIIGFLILFFITRKILEYAGFTEDKKEEIKKIKESKKDNEKNDNKPNKEKFINRELKDRGVGTFGSLQFTYDKEKRKDKELYDMSNLKPEEIKGNIDGNKEERENVFNQIKELEEGNKTADEDNYFNRLKDHLKNIDTYIGKMERIYSKVLLEKKDERITNGKLKYKPIKKKNKLTVEEQELLYNYPSGNLLSVSDDRNILETRIQSFDTDVKIVNKKRIIHELDNKVFNDEIKKSINSNKKTYVLNNLNYKYIDEDDVGGGGGDDGDGDGGDDGNETSQEQGLFRRIEYENLSKGNIDYFNNIEKYVVNILNKNKKLKITGGYEIIKTTDFKVVQKKINYILYNKNNKSEYIYDCEIVVYRESKNHGKHIGFKVLVNNDNIYLIDGKVIGIVSEDRISLLKASNEYVNNLVYYKYKNKYVITYNPRESEIAEMPESERIFLLRDRNNKLRLDRGNASED